MSRASWIVSLATRSQCALRYLVLGVQRGHQRLQRGVIAQLHFVGVRAHLGEQLGLLDRGHGLSGQLLHLHDLSRRIASGPARRAQYRHDADHPLSE